MSIILTPELKSEYERLFASCVITPAKKPEVIAIANQVQSHRSRYEGVEQQTEVPWFVVGAIHNLEASLNFHCHLHNGDPLSARTVHVPRDRPLGNPPFTWEQSAEDALKLDNLAGHNSWTIAETLYRLERFNGLGYRQFHPQTLSPYLWSWSNHQTPGKYVEDGRFDPAAISNQCGAATLLHYLQFTGVITFPTP